MMLETIRFGVELQKLWFTFYSGFGGNGSLHKRLATKERAHFSLYANFEGTFGTTGSSEIKTI
jgi:hypothetical protein